MASPDQAEIPGLNTQLARQVIRQGADSFQEIPAPSSPPCYNGCRSGVGSLRQHFTGSRFRRWAGFPITATSDENSE